MFVLVLLMNVDLGEFYEQSYVMFSKKSLGHSCHVYNKMYENVLSMKCVT
jgi:hypothetical protein